MPLAPEWLVHTPKPRPLTGDDKWTVFLSYRSVNRPWVLNLYDVLRQHGHEVFLDQVVLKAGDRLIKGLQAGLDGSQSGVLVWSSATADSEWVQREYETLETLATEKKGFQFVPVRLDEGKLPTFARNRIFLDFSAYPDGPNGGELLRLLYALVGQPLSPDAARLAQDEDDRAREANNQIGAAIRNKNPQRIRELFEQNGPAWNTSSALGCKAAQGLTELGENEQALALLTKLEAQFPRAIRPKQLKALALARRGQGNDLAEAQEILGTLYEQKERDPETLGIYARTWMDRFTRSGDVGDLKQSRALYAEAFEAAPDDYYTGINAAAKSVFLGTDDDLAKADQYAERVQAIVGTDVVADDYWKTATVAEVFLMRRKYADAARLYDAAVSMARTKVANHQSSWTQACRLMETLQPTSDERALVRAAIAHLPDPADGSPVGV
ncbi:MAG TPA: TRAFs-binding domain-containing protein [Vicinamibacterales bacterium]